MTENFPLLYPQLCIRAAAQQLYPVRNLFRLFQYFHCSFCPAGGVSDGSIPILISSALSSELIWSVHAFTLAVSALDSKGWISKKILTDNHFVIKGAPKTVVS